ncbi:MAG: toll/interleukin-1 receptor domain-containing protein [Achromobacter sp.]|uniref:toll/interleukin-1 receptor domain-containing protein n=1 Tax=Achromobacter sp. TaxID=134375 RepID=UPI0029A3963B|nr:toll/interleukin-1 receptor domain-containing protein [Achromobacter sp.]MDX3985990.1 toll/interleukin-1 receptor domain-containing protein [Achromobacter sp.]
MITPKVFISYSHDTPEHKMWVMKLAQKLMDNGIEVMLDMWELGPGDDIARFMERGLTEADRILMVCTEKYVHKAEAGQGGVGYEKMIVTAGYMKQVDSKRVIPIIRQNGTDHVPAFLGTKLYMDFSTDERAEYAFDELARELHGKPLYSKPKLGSVPNFDTAPPIEPRPTEDPILKAMKVVMAAYEDSYDNELPISRLIESAQATGMSRTYFETLIPRLFDKNLIANTRFNDCLAVTEKGRSYALTNKLV